MEPKHPAESKLWYAGIGFALIGLIFFTAIGDDKLEAMLAQIFFGLFIIAVAGAALSEILLQHAYWVEARQRLSRDVAEADEE